MAASNGPPVVISSAVTKCLIIVALLIWVICATTWLTNMTSREGCSLTLLARSRRSDLVTSEQAVATATELSEQVATKAIATELVNFQWPTNRTVKSKDEESDSIAKRYWSRMDQTKHDKRQNCTLVMLTYKRGKILPKVLMHYCNISLLQRILVIWNDVDAAVPEALLNLTRSCNAELMYIVSKENKLTNRYIPRSEIETDCKCMI